MARVSLSTADLYEEWERRYKATPEMERDFRTLSGDEVKPLYTERTCRTRQIGVPGEYPFTRGVYPSMYRGRMWTMRQFAGFGTAEETNERFRYLLDHGQQGLSHGVRHAALMGHDSDHKMSLGEVGREGVAIDTPDDMETLFQGIDLGETSVSMTVNAPAAIMMAYYVVAAERAGVPRDRLAGTVQADILKEYIAQKEWCFPVDPAMRLMGDLIEWCSKEMPRWHPVSISGYHIREAGSTAAQELAFTLKDGLTYVEQAVERGLDVDDFAPRLSFFFNAQIDFFEEIAKYRAARRIWARELRETFGAKNPKSWLMRFHTQTAGVSLTAQQPLNNIVRTAIEALAGRARRHPVAAHELLRRGARAAVGGGGPRRAPHAADHRPRDRRGEHRSTRSAARTAVEAMTDEMERQCYAYFDKIDQLGGMVPAVKEGYPQREIAEASYELQVRQDQGERVVVGVNQFTEGDDGELETLRVDPALERKQIDRLQGVRAKRDSQRSRPRSRASAKRAPGDENLLPVFVEAAEAHVSEGEIVMALQEVWGSYRETPVF